MNADRQRKLSRLAKHLVSKKSGLASAIDISMMRQVNDVVFDVWSTMTAFDVDLFERSMPFDREDIAEALAELMPNAWDKQGVRP